MPSITGLTAAEVEARRAAGQTNQPPKSQTKTTGEIVRDNVCTYFNLVFLVLAVMLALVHSWLNMGFLGIVFWNTLIGIVQQLRAKRTIDKLTLVSAQKLRCLRDGRWCEVLSDNLVQDDVVEFGAGDQIAADAVVLDGSAQANESLITGEARAIPKECGAELKSGSFLMAGRCVARLTRVGAESYASRLTAEAQADGHRVARGEMMRSLDKLIRAIGIALVPIGAALLYKQHWQLGVAMRGSVETTVAALIGMIPEGLYLLTSVALAVGMMRLARRRVLTQDMNCIETLARVDTLCVDKTGTVTENKMIVEDVCPLCDDRFTLEDIRMIMADYVYAMQADNDTMAALRRYFTGEKTQDATATLPFSSAKKYGGVSFHTEETYLLGAPDVLLAGRENPYQEQIEGYSAKGCRVLLLALYDGKLSDEALDAEMMPLALILLSNKIRPEAPQTFSYFAQQGVRTKVISGDNPLTVSEVARRAGIPDAEKFVDARTLKTDAELAKAAEDMTVFGRVTPDQKKKLVAAMKRAGHTVAMTGDGVNDVLALREADCSIAMASGSGVACQASHIVLLDSQFSALPSVVAEGRRVINNIERSASLYLVKNIFTFVLSLITLFFTLPYPYTPAQLSLVNALTIGIPSFILAMEPNENRISGRFLPNVIYRALPAALSDLILVVGVMLFYLAFHIKEDMLSTLCTGIMGIVGLLMVHQTSLPMNKLRKAMLVGLCIAFVVCYFFLPELFTLSALDKPSLLILVVLGLLAFSVMFVCRRGLRKVKARLNKGIFPRRKKR